MNYEFEDWNAAGWAYEYELMLEREFKESEEGIEWANAWIRDLLAVEVPTEVYNEMV